MSDAKHATSGKKKRILIVEDERPLAHALELKFQHEGYEVLVVSDGAHALKEAKSTRYNVILLDLIMPNMDGFTFMEELGTHKKEAKSKVIILSNLGQDEDKKRAEQLGAVGYYVKSNTPITEIVQHVKKIIA